MVKKAKKKASTVSFGKDSVKGKVNKWKAEGRAMIKEGKEKMKTAVKAYENDMARHRAKHETGVKKIGVDIRTKQREYEEYIKEFIG